MPLYLNIPDADISGFSDYSAGIDISYKIAHAGITYIGQGDPDILPEGVGGYDIRAVGVFGLSATF